MKKIPLYLAMIVILIGCTKDTISSDNGTDGDTNKVLNQQSTGTSANDLLSDDLYTSMVVEVVYVAGFEPSQAAINNFVALLEARTYKPNGITIEKRAIPSPQDAPYTNQNIVAVEDANRTRYNTDNQIAVWAFFADNESANNSDSGVILGTAYRNTSFVIYEQTIHELSNSPFEPNRSLLETTVMTHELGHILGLVNLGSDLQSDHEDTEHPKHCIVESCLMYFAAETGSGIMNMLENNTAPQFDAQCIADLRANGGK